MSSRGFNLEKQNLDRFDLSKNTSESTQRIDIDTISDDSNEMVIASAYDLPVLLPKNIPRLTIIQWNRESEKDITANSNEIDQRRFTRLASAIFDGTDEYRQSSPSRWTLRAEEETIQKINHKTRKSRFGALGRGLVLSVQSRRKSYEFVRSLAIAQAHNELVSKLKMIHAHHVCKYKEKLSDITLPSRMYSWSKKDFVERRKEHTLWVDMIQKQYSAACLHVIKFKIDIEELLRICKTLFGAFDCELQQTIESIMTSLEDALDFLKIEYTLADELVENLALMRQCLNSLSSFRASNKMLRDKINLLKVEDEDFRWNNSIESRYRVNYSYAQDAIVKYHTNLNKTKLETTLNDWKRELKYEEYRHQWVLNAYYTDIANFKSRIAELRSQYDKQFELIESAISYKTISMNKLEIRLLFLNEELTRFRHELRLLEERLLAEQKEQEELRKSKQESAALGKTKKVKRALRKKK